MKKFFWIFFSLILICGIGFATWFFVFRKDDRLTIEFYGDDEIVSCLSGDGKYKEGSVVMLKAKTRDGYIFEAWIKENEVVSNMQNYSFIMTEETAGKYTARYTPLDYTISNENQGNIHVAQTARMGELVVVNFNLPQGFEIEEMYYIIEGTEEKTLILGNRFIMPAGDIQVFVSIVEIKYTITYDLQGGDFEGERIDYYTINTPTFNLPDPVKEGFTFVGWTDDIITSPAMVYQVAKGCMKNFEVTANWERNTYNISTQTIGEGIIDIVDSGLFEENITPTITVEDGYFLSRLYYIIDGQENEVDIEESFTIPAGNITVYAVFAKVEYTITAVVEDCEFTIENPIASVGDDVVVVATPPQGYEVSRYYYVCEGSTDEVEFDQTFVMPTNNIEVHVEIIATLYTITYYTDDGVLPTEYTQSYTIEDVVTLPVPTKDHYDFDGWFENDELTGDAVATFEGQIGNKYFYAKYTIHSYTITFVNYDGTELESSKVNHGSMPEYKGQNPTRPMTAEYEYVFAGWDSEIVAATQVVTYTATYTQLARQYTITKAATNNGSFTASATARVGETVAISTAANVGYSFIRSYYVDSNGNRVDFTTSFVMPTSDVTIYVEFAKTQYTITKAATTNGSFTAPTNAAQGDEVTIVATPNSHFAIARMYYIEEGKTNEVIFTNSFTMPSANITIYVEFAKIEYAITKAATTNGSFSVVANATHGTNVAVTITPNSYYRLARSYYVQESESDEVEFSGSFTMPGGNVTVYVEFAKIEYTITKATVTNGSFTVNTSATHGETVSVTAQANEGFNIARMYYVVEGTTTEVDFSGNFTMPGNNITIYVLFESASYTISKGVIMHCTVTVPSSAAPNSTVTVTATPTAGYRILNMYYVEEGSLSQVTFSGSFIMPSANITIYVETEVIRYSITKAQTVGGTFEVTNSAASASVIVVNATPNSGYAVSRMYYIAEGTTTEVDFSGHFSMPCNNVTVYVVFEQVVTSYNITKTIRGLGTVDCVESAEPGETVSIGLTFGLSIDWIEICYYLESAPYEKVSVFNNEVNALTGIALTPTFIMPSENVDLVINFGHKTSLAGTPSGYTIEMDNYAITGDIVSILVMPDYINYTITTAYYAGIYSVDPVNITNIEEIEPGVVRLTFVMPDEPVQIYISVVAQRLAIRTNASHATVNTLSSAYPETSVPVEVTPASGYRVTRTYYVINNNINMKIGFIDYFTMPQGEVTIYVETVSTEDEEDIPYNFEAISSNTSLGWIDIESINPSQWTCSLQAIPYEWAKFEGWAFEIDGEIVSTAFAYNGNYREHESFYAIFSEKRQSQIFKSPSQNGSFEVVSSARPTTLVTVTATPDFGYRVSRMYYVVGNGNEEIEFNGSFTMPNADVCVYVDFEVAIYSISKAPIRNGTVSVVSSAQVGSTVTVTFTPASGYVLDSAWYTVEGLASTETPITDSFIMPNGPVTIDAYFAPIPVEPAEEHDIKIILAGDATLNASANKAGYGEEITLTLEMVSGMDYALRDAYYFTTESKEEININFTSSYAGYETNIIMYASFNMPDEDIIIYVLIGPEYATMHNITTNSTSGGFINCIRSAGYRLYASVDVFADEGYNLTSLYYIGETSGQRKDITNLQFSMPNENITIYAEFELPRTQYSITVQQAENGTINCASQAREGDTVTVTTSTSNVYTLHKTYYVKAGTTTEVEFTGSFVMPNGNITVYAEFHPLIFVDAEGCNPSSYTFSGKPGTEVSFIINPISAAYEENFAYYEDEIGMPVNLTGTRLSATEVRYTFIMPDMSIYIIILYTERVEDYDISVFPTQNGTVSFPATAQAGAVVQVTATPSSGYRVSTVYVSNLSDGSTVEFDLDSMSFVMPNAPVELLVTFVEINPTYTITKGPTRYGTITCPTSARQGETVNVTFAPNSGYVLGSAHYISGGVTTPIPATNSFIMPGGNVTIAAAFFPQVTVTVSGCATESFVISQSPGTNVTFTIDLFDAEQIETAAIYTNPTDESQNWLTGNRITDTKVEYSFTMPTAPTTIAIAYSAVATEYNITIAEMTNGSASCVSQARAGDTVLVTITPDEDYGLSYAYFENLQGEEIDCEDVECSDVDLSFTMPSTDIVIYIVFEELLYYPIIVANATGGSVICPTRAEVDDIVSFEVRPNVGYELQSLTAKNIEDGSNIAVNLTNNTFVMPQDQFSAVIVLLTPVFVKINYTITKNITNGTISIKNTATYNEVVNVTFAANENHIISARYYIEEGSTQRVNFINSFTMPAKNITVYVEFVETEGFTITKVTPSNGDYSCQTSARYNEAVVVNLSIPTSACGVYLHYIEETSDRTEYIYYNEFEQSTIEFEMPNDNITLYIEYLYCARINAVNCDVIDGEETEAYAGETVGIALHKDNSTHQLVAAYYIGTISGTRGELVYDGIMFSQHEFSFTMPAEPVNVYIKFAAASDIHNITVNPTSYGTVECESVAINGEDVVITVTPSVGYTLARTYYIIQGTTEKVEFVGFFEMPNNNITVYAEFRSEEEEEPPIETAKFTITWKNDNGEILETDLNVPENAMPTYNGPTPTKQDIPGVLYTFDTWSPTVTRATQDQIYTATYSVSLIQYTITCAPTDTSKGTFSASKTTAITSQIIDLTITPRSGYEVARRYYIAEGSTEEVELTYDGFAMPATNITVYVEFRAIVIKYSATLNNLIEGADMYVAPTQEEAGKNVCVIIPVAVEIPEGKRLKISYRPANNSSATPIEVEVISAGNQQMALLEMPNYNIVITAELVELSYTIRKVDETPLGGNFECPATASAGETVVITVTPNPDCIMISAWYRGLESNETVYISQDTLSFIMPEENIVIGVTFEPR